jgi:hypothetical protein
MPDFIEGHPRVKDGNEAIGIASSRCESAGVVESELLAVLSGDFGRMQQGALAGLAGSVGLDSRCIR